MSRHHSPNPAQARTKVPPTVSLPGSRRPSSAQQPANQQQNAVNPAKQQVEAKSAGSGTINQSQSNSPAGPSQQQTQQQTAASVDLMNIIGSQIKVSYTSTPSANEVLSCQGTLWCYDAHMGCIALEMQSTASPTSASANQCDYKIIKSNLVRNVELLSGPHPTANSTTIVKPISVDRVKRNESEAVEKDRKRSTRLGKGVSRLGQEIFDALSKTYPIEWLETSMVVLDDIIIEQPYSADKCHSKELRAQKGAATNSAATSLATSRLERVQKVLTGERARILQNMPDLGT